MTWQRNVWGFNNKYSSECSLFNRWFNKCISKTLSRIDKAFTKFNTLQIDMYSLHKPNGLIVFYILHSTWFIGDVIIVFKALIWWNIHYRTKACTWWFQVYTTQTCTWWFRQFSSSLSWWLPSQQVSFIICIKALSQSQGILYTGVFHQSVLI